MYYQSIDIKCAPHKKKIHKDQEKKNDKPHMYNVVITHYDVSCKSLENGHFFIFLFVELEIDETGLYKRYVKVVFFKKFNIFKKCF